MLFLLVEEASAKWETGIPTQNGNGNIKTSLPYQ